MRTQLQNAEDSASLKAAKKEEEVKKEEEKKEEYVPIGNRLKAYLN